MLNREDLLELTRRMTPSRNCFARIAGGYMSEDGFVDQNFNIHFGKLSPAETNQMLAIAKAIPFAETNVALKEHPFGKTHESVKIRQLLTALIECGLKNDALLMTFYELIGEKYESPGDYAIVIFQGNYDIPRKGMDKSEQRESEEVYSFLICAICPQVGKQEIGEPACGFLYPSFSDRSADTEHIAVYQSTTGHPELFQTLGIAV